MVALDGRTGLSFAGGRWVAEYERLKSEWKAESYEEEEVILAQIKAKLAAMRKREAEALRLLDGPAPVDDVAVDEGLRGEQD